MNQQEQRRATRLISLLAAVVLVGGLVAFLLGLAGVSLAKASYVFVFGLGWLSAVITRRRRA